MISGRIAFRDYNDKARIIFMLPTNVAMTEGRAVQEQHSYQHQLQYSMYSARSPFLQQNGHWCPEPRRRLLFMCRLHDAGEVVDNVAVRSNSKVLWSHLNKLKRDTVPGVSF